MTGDVPAAQRDAVFGWLERLKALARRGDVPSRAMLADSEMVRLADTLRAVLAAHEPDEDDRCPSCPARAQRRGYRCQVWVSVHKHLLATDPAAPDAPDASGGRHALSSQGRGLASW